MYDTARDLIDALAAGPDALAGVLAGVDRDLARHARGGAEGWSIVEVVCHLRDAEERALARLLTMRDEEDPILAAYDQDAWTVERDYAGDDLRQAAAVFAAHRADHAAVLRALPAGAWERVGTHEEHGRVTIENHTIHIATHDVQHLAQIARAVRDARA
ncbi:MAG: DinB family protein [Chloroflexota bacterium]